MPEDLHRRTVHRLVNTYYDKQLINNVDRGHYVECMIVLGLGEEWNLTSELRGWAPWDIERDDGARLEVKQSAALQTWSLAHDAPPPRTASFDIAFRKEPWTKGGDYPPYLPGRPADLYVFEKIPLHFSRTQFVANVSFYDECHKSLYANSVTNIVFLQV